MRRKTLLLLLHFLMLDLLNAWYNCTSGTKKSFWNSVRKMTNLLAYSRKSQQNFFLTKENYLRTRPFQCQHRFWTFRSVMEFRSFLEEKSRSATDTQKKLMLGSWCSHKRREKEVSPKIRHSSKILWNCSIFIVTRE